MIGCWFPPASHREFTMYALGYTDEPQTRTEALAREHKTYHNRMRDQGFGTNLKYNNLQSRLGENHQNYPSHANLADSGFNYEFMEHNRNAGISTPTGVNLVGCHTQSGQQNVLDNRSVSPRYAPNETSCYLPTTLQNCSQSVRTDPIVGLAQLAEKANFSLVEFGDTRSANHSRNCLPRIELQDRTFSFPNSPNLRNSLMKTNRRGFEAHKECFQGSFLEDSLNNTGNLGSYPGSTMTDISASRHQARHQERQASYVHEDQGRPLSSPGCYQYKYDNAYRESLSFDYYQALNKDKSGVIPNVTVFNTDPQTKSARFFAPVKSRSEEILKKTLSTFGKILSPTEGDVQRRDDKWPNASESKKDKRCPSTSSKGSGTGGEQIEDRLCSCKWIGCDAIYSEQDDLVRHIEKVHIDQRKADDLYICYWEQCTRQTKPFNARYKLVIHMRVHSGEKPNKCTVSRLYTIFVLV